MNPYKSLLLTAVPRTLEKRLEIINAIRTLTAPDDRRLKRRTEIIALRGDLEKLRQDVLELWRQCEPRARSYVIKYNPDQPRVPEGYPDGGQWTSEDGDEGASNGAAPNYASIGGSPYAALDTGTRMDVTGGAPGDQVAAGTGRPGYPIDLQGRGESWRPYDPRSRRKERGVFTNLR